MVWAVASFALLGVGGVVAIRELLALERDIDDIQEVCHAEAEARARAREAQTHWLRCNEFDMEVYNRALTPEEIAAVARCEGIEEGDEKP
jgi:hypothetical protein